MLPWTLRRWLGMADPEPEKGVVAAPPRRANAAYHHELATAVLLGRDQDGPYQAYAAWLSKNNDPRGGLIEAMIEGGDAALDPHRTLMGPLAFEDGAEVSWERGFWKTLEISRTWESDAVPELVAAALEHPSALVLDRLVVRADCIPLLAEVITDGPTLPVRHLVIDAQGGPLGTWASAWARLPSLTSLEMLGDNPQLGDLALGLHHLVLTGRLSSDALWSVARMNTPDLESLTLSDLSADQEAAERILSRFMDQLGRSGCSS